MRKMAAVQTTSSDQRRPVAGRKPLIKDNQVAPAPQSGKIIGAELQGQENNAFIERACAVLKRAVGRPNFDGKAGGSHGSTAARMMSRRSR